MKVKIINKSNNPLPSYATDGSAGLDLRANLERPITILTGHMAVIKTGIHLELPKGKATKHMFALVRDLQWMALSVCLELSIATTVAILPLCLLMARPRALQSIMATV